MSPSQAGGVGTAGWFGVGGCYEEPQLVGAEGQTQGRPTKRAALEDLKYQARWALSTLSTEIQGVLSGSAQSVLGHRLLQTNQDHQEGQNSPNRIPRGLAPICTSPTQVSLGWS